MNSAEPFKENLIIVLINRFNEEYYRFWLDKNLLLYQSMSLLSFILTLWPAAIADKISLSITLHWVFDLN